MRMRSRKAYAVNIPARRWLGYATAGAATALAGATSADGEIHYSGKVNFTFGPDSNKTVYFQLDQPGDSIAFRHGRSFEGGTAYFKAVGLQRGSFAGTYSRFEFAYVFRLRGTERYVSDSPFTAFGGTIDDFGVMAKGDGRYGDWLRRGTDYVGFRFNNGAGTQYGWARVR